MPELAGNVISSAQQLAIHYDSGSDAVRHANVNEIMTCGYLAVLKPSLRQRARSSRIFDVYRQARSRSQLRPYINSAPTERRRVQNPSGPLINHAWENNPDAFAGNVNTMSFQHLLNSAGQILDESRYRKDGIVNLYSKLSP